MLRSKHPKPYFIPKVPISHQTPHSGMMCITPRVFVYLLRSSFNIVDRRRFDSLDVCVQVGYVNDLDTFVQKQNKKNTLCFIRVDHHRRHDEDKI